MSLRSLPGCSSGLGAGRWPGQAQLLSHGGSKLCLRGEPLCCCLVLGAGCSPSQGRADSGLQCRQTALGTALILSWLQPHTLRSPSISSRASGSRCPVSSPCCHQDSHAPLLCAWLCGQVAAPHPLVKYNHGSTGHSAWKTLLCGVTERCQIIDVPDGCWLQIGNSLWPSGPRPWPCVGLFRVRLLNNRWLPWVRALAHLSAAPWASCDAQCCSWAE